MVALREGDRQLARRSDVAEEDGGQGVALLLAAIPALQHCRNLLEPGHQDRATAGHHHDGAWIGGDNRAHKQVLLVGQCEAWQVGMLVAVVPHDDDRHVQLPSERCSFLHCRRDCAPWVLPTEAHLAANRGTNGKLSWNGSILLGPVGCIVDP